MLKRMDPNKKTRHAQMAVEYLLLIAIVTGIVLYAMYNHMPRVYESAELYYNKATNSIMGEAPP